MTSLMQTDTFKSFMHFGTHAALTRIGDAARLDFGNVKVHGAVTPHLPQVALKGAGTSMNLWVSIQQIDVTAAIKLLLTPIDSWISGIERNQNPAQSRRLQPALDLNDHMNISISMNNLSLALAWLHMAAEPALSKLQVDQFQSLQCMTQCAAEASAQGDRSIFVERLEFQAFPQFLRAGQLGSLEDSLINTFVKGLMLLLKDSGPALASLSRGSVNVLLQRLLSKSTDCPPSSVYYGIPEFTTLSFWTGILCLTSGICLCFLGNFFPVDWHDREMEENSRSVAEPGEEHVDSSDDENGTCFERRHFRTALCRHPKVPFGLALSYPFFIFATILLFVYGDFSLGTTLQVVFKAHGRETIIGPIFSFSLISIIKDSYAAGAYLFAFLAAGMSGIWPLAKLVLLLCCWVLPTSQLSSSRRGTILVFLDQYGKYSLVDIWLGVIGLASYNLHWEGPDGSSLKVQPVVLDGFFVFIIATVASLILGHVGAIYHKKTELDAGGGLTSPIISDLEGDDAGNKRHVSKTCCVIFLLLLMPIIVMKGTSIDSFKMITGGMAADMLSEPWDRETYYSTISLGYKVVEGDPSAVGLKMIQWFIYFFTLVIPVILSLLLIPLWLLHVARPKRPKLQATLLTWCRILDAWNALDVFALAVLVSAMEIEIFARYLVLYDNIHQGCMWVKQNLNTDCMEARCEITIGFGFLALAGILSYALPKVIFYWVADSASQSVREREVLSDNEPQRGFFKRYGME
jgi:hypothetical protein